MAEQALAKRAQRALMVDKSLSRGIILLAWPVMAEMFLQTLAQIVDMAMVGRLGQAAIAAVGLSFRPLFVGQAIFLGLGVATTALVARFIGAGDKRKAALAAEQSLLTTSVLALLLAMFGYLFARQITLFMGAAGDVVELGTSYLLGFSPGLFFLMLATIMTSSLRAAGDTRTPFYAGAVSNVVNVILNYLLIFGKFGFPELGVLGAAIATSISRVVAALMMSVALVQGRGGLHLDWRGFTVLDWSMISRLFRIGIPAAIERFVQSLSMMLHLKILATLGTTAVAVSTLGSNVEQLSFMPSIGFSVAASTLVGQSLGAKRPEDAERKGWESVRLSSYFMGIMGLLFIIIPDPFVRIYTSDPALLGPAKELLRIIGLTQLPQAIANTASGILRGAGDTKVVLGSGLFGNVLLRLGFSYLFVIVWHWGLWSAFVAVIIDWVIRAGLIAYVVKRGKWKTLRV